MPATASRMETSEAKIALRELSKEFRTRDGSFLAIDRISLEIPRGSFFMIVGPSGCGKTTLLRILAGLERPTSGSITVARDDTLEPSRRRPLNALIFQQE